MYECSFTIILLWNSKFSFFNEPRWKKNYFHCQIEKKPFFLLFLQRKTLKSDVLSSQIGEGTY